jgi:DNA-binding NtrC family response regulator
MRGIVYGSEHVSDNVSTQRMQSSKAEQVEGTEQAPGLEILLVDDEPDIAGPIEEALTEEGHDVTVAHDGAEAMAWLDTRVFDLVISDVRLPRVDGLTIFRRLRQESPSTAVILITAYASVSDAVDAIKEKAAHYLAKPFELEDLLGTVEQIANQHRMEVARLKARDLLDNRGKVTTRLIGEAPAMVRLKKRIVALADSNAAVLITGESGTGKDLVARTIHDHSSRRKGPFSAVNCAAFPDTLLEAELFGHERGAFTGATRRREGRIKAADGGTLFLDELGELSPSAQAKLLRVLETKEFTPLGTNESVKSNVRLVSATNADLERMVAQNTFREDLYYRIKVFHVRIPPLREHRSDLPLLIEYFHEQMQGEDAPPPRISPRAWAALSQFRWPGNVRELQHALQHAFVLAGDAEITLEHLPDEIRGDVDIGDEEGGGSLQPLALATQEFEREYLLRALNLAEGNRGKASKLLGISRKTLWAKMRRHRIRD